jgi:hypothetical protein
MEKIVGILLDGDVPPTRNKVYASIEKNYTIRI